jgi:putative aldouronate transport system permease protein
LNYISTQYRIFTIFNLVFLGFLAFLCVAPLIHILAVSFSSPAAASANIVKMWPVGFTIDAYTETFGNDNFSRALWNGVSRTVVGTVVSMILMGLAAYGLSKNNSEFRGRTFYMWFFVFTMLLNAGLIPTYILVQNLGLVNTIWALVLPNAINIFNMILLLNFFRVSVPKALEEAAYIDGAGHFRTVFSIYLPISMPAIATISLFTMVWHWNSWFDGMIFMTDPQKYPLSTFLQTIVVQQDLNQLNIDPDEMENLSDRTVMASQIFIGSAPILMVYPFLQRYFVKGIVMGSVKE